MAKKTTEAPISIHELYKNYVLELEKRPTTVYHFAKFANIEESKVYEEFGSIEQIEKSLLKSYVSRTLEILKSDENYSSFSVREKLLAFFFTLLNQLKPDRSYLLMLSKKGNKEVVMGIKEVKKLYMELVHELLSEAYSNGEVEERGFLGKLYPEFFWATYGYIMGYWFKDDSAGFEQSDAAVEKSVNLLFDGLAKGTLDRLVDFGRFNLQKMVN